MIITFPYISYKNLHLLALCIIKTNKNSVFVQFCKYAKYDYT